jgi:hypothetical protein
MYHLRKAIAPPFFLSPLPAGVYSDRGVEKKGKGRQFRTLGFNSLRHTFVSELANASAPADVRRQISGHNDEKVHERYTHLDVETKRRACRAYVRSPSLQHKGCDRPRGRGSWTRQASSTQIRFAAQIFLTNAVPRYRERQQTAESQIKLWTQQYPLCNESMSGQLCAPLRQRDGDPGTRLRANPRRCQRDRNPSITQILEELESFAKGCGTEIRPGVYEP